jgi:hypothetical protein
MKVSELKHKIELMKLNQKHAVELLNARHEEELKELLKTCKHEYDDGSSAKQTSGSQFNSYHTCSICGKNM